MITYENCICKVSNFVRTFRLDMYLESDTLTPFREEAVMYLREIRGEPPKFGWMIIKIIITQPFLLPKTCHSESKNFNLFHTQLTY